MPKMSEGDLVAILQAEWQEAMGSDVATALRDDRQRALSYYEGDMTQDLPDPLDRSKAVSTDVADTVEGMMPGLVEVFLSGDEVVVFNAVGKAKEDGTVDEEATKKDVMAAAQETDYINHVVMQQNNGFLAFYTFFKDALISKIGVIKAWWEERDDETKETYRGLTDDEFAMLMADDEIDVVEHSTYMLGHEPMEAAEGSV